MSALTEGRILKLQLTWALGAGEWLLPCMNTEVLVQGRLFRRAVIAMRAPAVE